MNARIEFPNYVPKILPKQELLHKTKKKYRLYCGGFGSGKTLWGAYESILLSLDYPKNLGLVGRLTYPELRDTTRRELLEFAVRINGVDYQLASSPLVRRFSQTENTLEFFNGSQILFRALEDSFDKIKSLNLGFFWVDELTEIDEEMWMGLCGRLRRKNVWHAGFGTTNPEGHDWVWKKFIANPDKDAHVVVADSYENYHLPAGYLEELEKYPDEWKKRYLHGSFDTFEGLVYKEFNDRSPHVVQPFEIPDHWFRFVGIDHGYRNPCAVLWAAVDERGNVTIYDEFYSSGKRVSEIANVIKAKTGKTKIRQYLIDPATKQDRGANGTKTIFTEFEEDGIFCIPANNEVSAGINRVKEYLSGEKPRLKVFQTCTSLRTEFQTYRWKDLKPGQTRDRDNPEKPQKKDDHAMDALRYMIAYVYDTPELKSRNTFSYDWRKALKSRMTKSFDWMAA